MYLETEPAALADYVKDAARLMQLPIGADLLPTVIENYGRLVDAANVLYVASIDLEEPAPVFAP
jgi:hypothetical protein